MLQATGTAKLSPGRFVYSATVAMEIAGGTCCFGVCYILLEINGTADGVSSSPILRRSHGLLVLALYTTPLLTGVCGQEEGIKAGELVAGRHC